MDKETFTKDEERWQAVVTNNACANGIFYYGVITTGIYCLPSCASKLPNRDNVTYFTNCEAAEAASYRACKRCRPTTASKKEEIELKITRACRIIEQSPTQIRLDDLAQEVGLSSYHFHRLFKKMIGVTPKQYATRNQSQDFCKNLISSPTVTDAIYSAGFGSSGSAYDKKRDQLAMKPTEYRKGAEGIAISYGLAQCSLGLVIVAATDRGICAIELGDKPDELITSVTQRFPKAVIDEAGADFITLVQEVVEFIESPKEGFNLPLDIQGTAFQQQVWSALQKIKPGQTVSYSDIATQIDKPKAVRAVATACASNKLAVVIPCHRVVSKTGKISGYRWGVERKKSLLEIEQNQ